MSDFSCSTLKGVSIIYPLPFIVQDFSGNLNHFRQLTDGEYYVLSANLAYCSSH